jgi:defect-in-organelle-trafficking protein DotD
MISWKILAILASVASAVILSSCTKTENLNYTYLPTSETPVEATSANTQKLLASNSEEVKHSMDELSAIQKTLYPNVDLKKPINARAARLSQRVSIDWAGPVEGLLNQISKLTGYKVKVLGVKPSIPAIVSLSMKNVTVADVLRNAALQVVKKADIVVYPSNNVIEMRYYHL